MDFSRKYYKSVFLLKKKNVYNIFRKNFITLKFESFENIFEMLNVFQTWTRKSPLHTHTHTVNIYTIIINLKLIHYVLKTV